MKHYDSDEPIKLGKGHVYSIARSFFFFSPPPPPPPDTARLTRGRGLPRPNRLRMTGQPDGHAGKVLDVSRLSALGGGRQRTFAPPAGDFSGPRS